MNTLILIRHGEPKGHMESLSPRGKIQMQDAGKFVKGKIGNNHPHVIGAFGPSSRESAHIVADNLLHTTPLIVENEIAFDLAKNSIEKNPGDLPKVIVMNGKRIRILLKNFSQTMQCGNPLPDIDDPTDKGEAYAIICDFDINTLTKVSF